MARRTSDDRSCRPAATTRPRVVAVVRADAPDPLVPFGDGSALSCAVRELAESGSVDAVLVVAGAGCREAVSAAVHGTWPVPVSVCDDAPGLSGVVERCAVHGGQRRGGSEGDARLVVLVHDAARPRVPASLVEAVVAAAAAGHAVTVPVLPLTDTVKSCDDEGRLRGTPDRSGLRVVQTPQAFRADLLAGTLAAVLDAPPGRSWCQAGTAAHTVPGDPHAVVVRAGRGPRTANPITARPEDQHP